MTDQSGGFAFIVLLADGDDASGLARLLEDVRLPAGGVPSVFAAAPIRGLDFFADESSQGTLDEWWAASVPGDAHPVYLLMHEDGLSDWLKGLDGTFYIGIPKPDLAAQYSGQPQIKAFLSGGPLDFATVIMRDFSSATGDSDERSIFDHGEALRMAALSSDFPIDLDDSAFDFGDAAAAAAQQYPQANPYAPSPGASPYGTPPGYAQQPAAPYGPGPAPFPATPPYAPAPAPFGAQPAASQSLPRPHQPVEPATPHPFDLLSGGGSGRPPSGPVKPIPVPQDTPWSQPPAPPTPPASPDWAASQPPANDWAAPANGNGGRPESGFSSTTTGGGSSRSRGRGPRLELPSFPFLKGRGGAPRSGFTETPSRELAALMVERGPTLVVMGSRKGGVGKTSYAAGIAIVAGQILDSVGHKAAIVDANIANPDAWGQMNLREGAATVREVVAALTANHEPPPAVHATTPALACYPESRETTEYSKTDIKRFAEYLKRRYTFIVVDMSNRLPDPMAGPEAAAAAYWLEHADVLILPTTSSKQDFNGVLDYLDVRDLPPTVVPYIVPNIRRNREHPVTQQYLAVIRERVHRIVDVPDEADKVRFAGMEGIPVEQVSPTLRAAYRELTECIVRVPPRARI